MELKMEKVFNVRVYGIILNIEEKYLIVCDEFHYGMHITKFPGGGLEFGEGSIEGLKRELMEESGLEMEIKEHFYTTDFFQVSAFHENQQIISIYYIVNPLQAGKINTINKAHDVAEVHGTQKFRRLPFSELSENSFTFPIDRKVAGMLKEYLESEI